MKKMQLMMGDFILLFSLILMIGSLVAFVYFINNQSIEIRSYESEIYVASKGIGVPIGLALIFKESMRQFVIRYKELNNQQ